MEHVPVLLDISQAICFLHAILTKSTTNLILTHTPFVSTKESAEDNSGGKSGCDAH